MNKFYCSTLFLLSLTAVLLGAVGNFDGAIQKAYDASWRNFFSPRTNLFYDYLTSYETGKTLDHLPTADEVKAQKPNYCGYGTGMEDCAISGGAMLSAIVDWAAIGGDKARLSTDAKKVFDGLVSCVRVHGVRGFVARGICVEDGKSVYINSSRDQCTHLVHGVWKYLHSPLISQPDKNVAAKVLSEIADRMIETVVEKNDFDSLRADGTRCGLRISRMWNVDAHEAARLPMIYAAAWKSSGDKKYEVEYRKYLADALEQSANVGIKCPAYAMLQMQCSLELLKDVADSEKSRAQIDALMLKVADITLSKAKHELGKMKTLGNLDALGPDWRKPAFWRDQSGYNIPDWGDYRKIWNALRGSAEGVLTCQMSSMKHEKYDAIRSEIISLSDYDRMSSCGIIYHFAIMVRGG